MVLSSKEGVNEEIGPPGSGIGHPSTWWKNQEGSWCRRLRLSKVLWKLRTVTTHPVKTLTTKPPPRVLGIHRGWSTGVLHTQNNRHYGFSRNGRPWSDPPSVGSKEPYKRSGPLFPTSTQRHRNGWRRLHEETEFTKDTDPVSGVSVKYLQCTRVHTGFTSGVTGSKILEPKVLPVYYMSITRTGDLGLKT